MNEDKQDSSFFKRAPNTHVPSSIAVHPGSDDRPGDELSMLGCDDATESPTSLLTTKSSDVKIKTRLDRVESTEDKKTCF